MWVERSSSGSGLFSKAPGSFSSGGEAKAKVESVKAGIRHHTQVYTIREVVVSVSHLVRHLSNLLLWFLSRRFLAYQIL